jgi:hypothetical protein
LGGGIWKVSTSDTDRRAKMIIRSHRGLHAFKGKYRVIGRGDRVRRLKMRWALVVQASNSKPAEREWQAWKPAPQWANAHGHGEMNRGSEAMDGEVR